MSPGVATQMATNVTTLSDTIRNSSQVSTTNSAAKFDLKIVRDAFVNCIQADNALLLCEYIRAYEELCV